MLEKKPVPAALLERIKAIKNKRARFVLDQIVQNGSVSTTELKNAGYDHPPRARRDAVELGFALKTIKAKRDDGQTVAAYIFDEAELDPNKTGRVVLPKKERDRIIAVKGNRCNACGATHNLQVDHRIPYEVAGESQKDERDPYQVLDGSCNRRKSWACEHCQNLLELKIFETYLSCYWANPEGYSHVAMQPERRLEIVWTGEEVKGFDAASSRARKNGKKLADYIKATVTME